MENLDSVATHIRRLSLQMTTKSQSGYPASSLSCADILAVLFGEVLTYDPAVPQNLYNDRFILSKGHAAPALYATYALLGWIPMRELDTYGQKDSRLEGHTTRSLPYIDVATGSLGLGIANGLGMSVGLTGLDPVPMTYVLVGDGELSQGSVWEALALATNLGITRICVIVDVNGLGQSGSSLFAGNTPTLSRRFESFGWKTHVADGHDLQSLSVVLGMVTETDGPHVVLCSTTKGKGVSFMEGKEDWHSRVLSPTELTQALEELGNPARAAFAVKKPLRTLLHDPTPVQQTTIQSTFLGLTSTKKAFSEALAQVCMQSPDLLVLDADTKNSTAIDIVQVKTPRQFLELSISQGSMVGIATGLNVVGKKAVVSTYAAYLSRSFDQLRMNSLSQRSVLVHGSHAGVSSGADGASAMGLQDISMMRGLQDSIVLSPSDAYSAFWLTKLALNQLGTVYIRTTPQDVSLLYSQTTQFPLGGSHVHAPSDQDKVTIITAGITLFEALAAQNELRAQGILVRVIDLYSIKPIDVATLGQAAQITKGNIVVVEDHHPEGGIGDAVRTALDGLPIRLKHLAVRGIPHSAQPQEELSIHHIDAASIVNAVKEIMQ